MKLLVWAHGYKCWNCSFLLSSFTTYSHTEDPLLGLIKSQIHSDIPRDILETLQTFRDIPGGISEKFRRPVDGQTLKTFIWCGIWSMIIQLHYGKHFQLCWYRRLHAKRFYCPGLRNVCGRSPGMSPKCLREYLCNAAGCVWLFSEILRNDSGNVSELCPDASKCILYVCDL